MILNIVFLKVKKDLSKTEKKRVKEIIYKHALKAGKLLGVDLINIVIHPTKSVIEETGESGFATDDWIKIGIDPNRRKNELKKIISEIIPATIYHEMYHIGRDNYLGKSQTLFDSVIAEGLADVFAEEQWPNFHAPWNRYNIKTIKIWLKEFRKKGNSKKYSHDEWFFGAVNKPKWLGYKLGSYIIHSIKEKNRKLTALKMIKMPTRKIILKNK